MAAIAPLPGKFRPVAPVNMRGIEPAAIDAAMPLFDWVAPQSLCIEEEYQRDLSERSITMVRRIVSNWSWSKIKPIICVRVGNRLAVIDGQHTAIAAVTHGGIAKVPVMIVDAPTVKERAAAFLSQNIERLSLTPMHLHFAAVAAGDEIAVAVSEACRKSKVTILRNGRGTGGKYRVGETFAVGIISRIVKKIGVHHGARVLKILVDAKRAPVPAHEIAAVYRLLYLEPYRAKEIDPFDLVTCVRSRSSAEWQSVASKLIATGTPRREAIAAAWFKALRRAR